MASSASRLLLLFMILVWDGRRWRVSNIRYYEMDILFDRRILGMSES
jgi:hypothetical protein